MGIFSRIGTLFKSNINDMISKAEDPEKMLSQVLADMKDQLNAAKQQVAVAIADEKRLAKQLEAEIAQAREWEKKAMMAVRAADDELAKQALARKGEHDNLAAQFQEQWNKQHEAVERLKGSLRLLNDKIEEAKRKKNILIARKKRAEAQKQIQATMQGLNDVSAFDTFDRMAEKVDALEAQAEASAELGYEMSGDTLKARFQALEHESGADDALAELKAKMGLAAPPQMAQLPPGQASQPAQLPNAQPVEQPVPVGVGAAGSGGGRNEGR
jgi:phage shock protein A